MRLFKTTPPNEKKKNPLQHVFWQVSILKTMNGGMKTKPRLRKRHLESLTSQYGPQFILQEPSLILDRYRFGLIFTDQLNNQIDSGIHFSLHDNCHHQIIYSKFHMKIFHPPLYERSI